MTSDKHIRRCLRSLGSIRARLVGAALIEGFALAASAWALVFSLEVGVHSVWILSSAARSVLRILFIAAAVLAWSAWTAFRLKGKVSTRDLVALAEEHDERFKGRLASAIDGIRSGDPVAALIAQEAASIIDEKPPVVPFRTDRRAVKFTAAVALLCPLLLLAGGPRTLVSAVADCLFPQRESTLEVVFRPGRILPDTEILPANAPIDFEVTYNGWPPVEATLAASEAEGGATIRLSKAKPGFFVGSSEFPPGEAALGASFLLRTLAGEKRVDGPKRRYRFLEPVTLKSIETVVRSPFFEEPLRAGGLEVLLPPGGDVEVAISAGIPLSRVDIEGAVLEAEIEGAGAGIILGAAKDTAFRFRLLPVDGLASRWYTYRLVVEEDAPPRLAAFVKGDTLHISCADDWALSRCRIEAQSPDGVKSRSERRLSGRSASEQVALEKAFPGPPGRYLVTVVVEDAASPEPNRVSSPVLVYERKPDYFDDPLLADLPRKTQRFLARKPPPPPPETEGSSPSESPPPGEKRGPETLDSPPPSGAGAQPPPEGGAGKRPRYAGPSSSGREAEDRPEPPPDSGGAGGEPEHKRPPSLPEGGVAGKGEGGGGVSGSQDEGAEPGNVGVPGGGRQAPVDGGQKSGYETGPTPVFAESVDEERVDDLEVSEDEVAAVRVEHPFAGKGEKPGEEVQRRPGEVGLDGTGGKEEEPFDVSLLPARYRALLEVLQRERSPRTE